MSDEVVDEEALRGTKVHENVVDIIGYNVHKIRYIEGSFAISAGQPYNPVTPVECEFESNIKEFMTWKAKIFCGRHKTAPIADIFLRNTGGEAHITRDVAAKDNKPRELNFTFGLEIDLKVDEVISTVQLYLGQGSTFPFNNWWAGMPRLELPKGSLYYQFTADFAGKQHLFHFLTPYGHTFQFALQ